jgi:hypothetical protein
MRDTYEMTISQGKTEWDTDEHIAAQLKPNPFTPSLPSPLEGEGLPCGVWKGTPQGKGGGDAFCLIKFKDFAKE